MFDRIATLVIAVILIGAIETTGTSVAQEKSTAPRFATLDVASILQISEASKSARSQIDQLRSDYQLTLKGEQNSIAGLSQSIDRDRPTLSQDVLQKRIQDLRQKAAGFQRDVQQRQAQINRALSAATVEIERKIVSIAETVKKEHGYSAIINRTAIVGTADLPDVTQEVLVQLNLQLPTVTVEVPQPAGPPQLPTNSQPTKK